MEQMRKRLMEQDAAAAAAAAGNASGSRPVAPQTFRAPNAGQVAQQNPVPRDTIVISSDEDSEEDNDEDESSDDDLNTFPVPRNNRIRRGPVIRSDDEEEEEPSENESDNDEESEVERAIPGFRTMPGVHSGALINGIPVPDETENSNTNYQSSAAPAFPVPRPDYSSNTEPRHAPLMTSNTNVVNATPVYPTIPGFRPLSTVVPLKPKGYPIPVPVMPGAMNAPRNPPAPYISRGELLGGYTPQALSPIEGGAPFRSTAAEEAFELPVHDTWEPFRTPQQAEEDLKQLMQHAIEDTAEEIDEADRFVEGFSNTIQLLPHQIIARRWMRERENPSEKKYGGILADDMGLGKTIQAITRIIEGRPAREDLKDGGWARSTLVVCPVGLMDQWEKEIHRITPGLRVVQHHGAARTDDPKVLARNDVVITSYTIVANEFETKAPAEAENKAKKKKAAKAKKDDFIASDDELEVDYLKTSKKTAPKKKKMKCALFGVMWWRIILDEAHNIKNRATKTSKAACELDGKYRWALTGTPLQNNVEELFPLFKFLRIKPLNDWDSFKSKIAEPIKKNRTKAAMQRLHLVLKAVMLRRSKTSTVNGQPILVLPERNVMIEECEFDKDEQEFYNAIAEKAELTFNKFMKEGTAMKQYTAVLTILLRLRQACNHPSLVAKDFVKDIDAIDSAPADADSDVEGDLLADAMKGLSVVGAKKCTICQTEIGYDASGAGRCAPCDAIVAKEHRVRRKSMGKHGDTELPPSSAKVRKIIELLLEIREKDVPEGEPPRKAIVFSQFTSFLDILEPFLKDERIKFVRLDGTMIPADRAAVVEKIKNSRTTNVILVSFKAGSTGLNLTCCDHVILSDLWWNPALEDQAFDRAHRYGQKRDVQIYKLTIPLTVEARILELQDKKRELADAALSGGKFKKGGNRLNLEDLMRLFRHDHEGLDDE